MFQLTQLHYFTDNRVWVERMYETDLRVCLFNAFSVHLIQPLPVN